MLNTNRFFAFSFLPRTSGHHHLDAVDHDSPNKHTGRRQCRLLFGIAVPPILGTDADRYFVVSGICLAGSDFALSCHTMDVVGNGPGRSQLYLLPVLGLLWLHCHVVPGVLWGLPAT